MLMYIDAPQGVFEGSSAFGLLERALASMTQSLYIERGRFHLYVGGKCSDAVRKVVVLHHILLGGGKGAMRPGLCPQGFQTGLALCQLL